MPGIRNPPAAARALAALLLPWAGLVFTPPASAEIYGWTDASGETTYSNLPPPAGARVTDIIHETPLSPQAVAEAAHRTEVSELNDRIRLLELEMARQQRQVVDFAAPPATPAGLGCGPGGYADCNPSYDYSPYFTTGLWYGNGMRGRHDGRGHGHASGRPGHGGPMRISHAGAHGAKTAH